MKSLITQKEIVAANSQQVYTLEKNIQQGHFSIESVGDHLPGNVLVTDLNSLSTIYMNNAGCDILRHSVEELQELGPEYFQRFFVPEEMNEFVPRYLKMHQQQDMSQIYNFAHRVKTLKDNSYKWYMASAKLMYVRGKPVADKMLLIVNEVNTVGYITSKINDVLEESDWMKERFPLFCKLTKREKDIITLVVNGNNTPSIAEILHISKLTVNTHRRNIAAKLGIKTFSGLYRFAQVFGIMTDPD